MEGFLISLGGEWMASGPLHAGWGCLPHRLLHHRPSKLWEGLWTKDPAPQGPADGRHSYHFGWQQKWLSAMPRSVRVRWEGVRSWALPLHTHTGPQAGSLPRPPARLQPGAGGGGMLCGVSCRRLPWFPTSVVVISVLLLILWSTWRVPGSPLPFGCSPGVTLGTRASSGIYWQS